MMLILVFCFLKLSPYFSRKRKDKIALKKYSYRILPSRLIQIRDIRPNNKSSLNLTYHLNKFQNIHFQFYKYTSFNFP